MLPDNDTCTRVSGILALHTYRSSKFADYRSPNCAVFLFFDSSLDPSIPTHQFHTWQAATGVFAADSPPFRTQGGAFEDDGVDPSLFGRFKVCSDAALDAAQSW